MKFISRAKLWLLSPRVIRNTLLVCTAFVTLLVLFYTFENWRGAKGWAMVVKERKAQGQPTDWREIVPAHPLPFDNFCAIPLFEKMVPSQPGNKFMARDEGNSEKPFPKIIYLTANQPIPLAEIADYYRKTPSFPSLSHRASDAETILAALGKYAKERSELVQALEKPYAVFPIDYNREPAWEIEMPYFGPLMNMSNTLTLHATAALAAGKTAEAMEDLRIQFRLSKALSQEPLLISQLVGTTIININLQTIWEGLWRRTWSTEELSQITALLTGQDALKNMRTGFEGEEIIFFTRTVDYLKGRSFSEKMGFFKLLHDFQSPKDQVSEASFGIGLGLMPKGWFDQNKIKAFHFYKEYIMGAIDSKNHRLDLGKISKFESAIASEKENISPQNFLVVLTLPSLTGAIQTMAQTQSLLDMARIACQLEVYYQKHHLYPESLASLEENLPCDIFTGKPYLYRLTPDGRYKLWSVGWNQSDEDGVIAYKNSANRTPDRTQGDWVWAYPEK